jgi:hypothetical protein
MYRVSHFILKPIRQNSPTASRPQAQGWSHHQPYSDTNWLATSQPRVQGYQQPPFRNAAASDTQYQFMPQPGSSTPQIHQGSPTTFYRKHRLFSAVLLPICLRRTKLTISWSTKYSHSSLQFLGHFRSTAATPNANTIYSASPFWPAYATRQRSWAHKCTWVE